MNAVKLHNDTQVYVFIENLGIPARLGPYLLLDSSSIDMSTQNIDCYDESENLDDSRTCKIVSK
jgi:hypothetical protein